MSPSTHLHRGGSLQKDLFKNVKRENIEPDSRMVLHDTQAPLIVDCSSITDTQEWETAVLPGLRTLNDSSGCSVFMEREMTESMGLYNQTFRDLEKETGDW